MFKKITVSGSSYQMGYKLGEFFKCVINKKIGKFEEALKDKDKLKQIQLESTNICNLQKGKK